MKKWWLLISLLCIVLTVPSMFHKHKLESNNHNVEFMVEYTSLLLLKENYESEADAIPSFLTSLKEAGITSIGVQMNSLGNMNTRGFISYMDGMDMQSNLVGTEFANWTNNKAQYIVLHDNSLESYLDETIEKNIDEYEKKQIGSQTVYAIYGHSRAFLSGLELPVLPSDTKLITSHGFDIVAMVNNHSEESDENTKDQIKQWGKAGVLSKVMFQGTEVAGYSDRTDTFYPLWKKYGTVYTEVYNAELQQKGIKSLIKETDYQAVRGHIVTSDLLNTQSVSVLHERIVKAVEERNNRLIQIGLVSDAKNKPEDVIKNLDKVVSETIDTLEEKGFSIGVSEPFNNSSSTWLTVARLAFLVLAANLFALLISYISSMKWSIIGWGTALIGMAGAYIVMPNLLWTLLPFGLALLYPTLLGVALWKEASRITFTLTKTIGLFIGISLLTILVALSLTSIHASIPFILYVEQFRGVGLAHLLPIILVFGLIVYLQRGISLSSAWWLLNQPIRIYQVLLGGILLVVAAFYLMRTGNGGIMLPFEAELRSLLQNAFEYRPRTKEFLFGHPLLIVILFYWNRNRITKWLLPIAIIGQLSILNTFTHLHTPLMISLSRSLIGVLIGLVVGLVLIAVVNGICRLWKKI